MGYIKVPIETNPQTLAQDIFDYIQSQQPNWTPNDGNLDTWIIKATAAKAAENRTLASDVPDDIFATLGSSLFAIPPVDDVAASGNTTWTLSDTIGHTIPANTYVGIQNADGDLVTFRTVADVVVAPGSSVTAIGAVQIVATQAGSAPNGLNAAVQLVTVLAWVQSIVLTAPISGGVDAETIDDYLDRLTRKLSLLSTVPILTQDFANAAKDASPSVYRAVAIDGYNPLHNLLSVNDASFETSVAGYTSAATLAQSAVQAESGTKSMTITNPTTTGDQFATLIQADEIAVAPGKTYTARADFRAATAGRLVKVGIGWYTAGNVIIGSNVYGSTVSDVTTGWVTASVTAVAPATAAFARVVLYIVGELNAEAHYVDEVSFRHGTGVDWVAGGTPETGNIRTVTIASVDSNGNDVSSGVKSTITSYINGKREANWVTYTMSPKYTQIDVAATITVLPGYDPIVTNAAVVTALTNYLQSVNWGLDPNASSTDAPTTWIDVTTVYYNELISLVSNVGGVGRVSDLTSNIHGFAAGRVDIAIDSPATLTQPGTITSVNI